MARQSLTRYFVNCTAPTSDEAHDVAARHGRVLAIRITSREPLGRDAKPSFPERFDRNRALRPVNIRVKLKEEG